MLMHAAISLLLVHRKLIIFGSEVVTTGVNAIILTFFDKTCRLIESPDNVKHLHPCMVHMPSA